MGMAWCKVSSLTAAVARTLKPAKFPMTRAQVLALAAGKSVEGWEIVYFLRRALGRKSYNDVRSVMSDLESWLEAQS
jgi:hypothetical protein